MNDWIEGSYVGATQAHSEGAEVERSDRTIDDVAYWLPVTDIFSADWHYRWRKPVVYREVHLKYLPMTERPAAGTRYRVPDATMIAGYVDFIWRDSPKDDMVFDRGMCFAEENVQEYIKQHGWVK